MGSLVETVRRPSSLAFSLVTVVFAVSYFLGSLEGDVQVKPGATVTVKTQNTAMQEWWDDDGLVWGDDDSDEANTAGAEDTSTPVAAEDTHESVPTPPQPASATMKPLSTEPRTPTEEPGFLKHPSYYSPVYLPRAREPVAETPWGSWDWEDPRNEHRVLDDAFYQQFPQRDVTEWPQNTWQTNTVYLSEFLKQSKALVERSMEAILHEYGHSNLQEPERSFEERSEMFSLTFLDHGDKPPKYYMNSGWTTQRSFQGLQRRILHSILTEDTFVVAMGGHSAAAGHGNHFQQSYTLQVQRVLEPVFARLGVAMQARNFGMGGLGTLHNSLAAGSLYGPDVDLLIWDSGMTEKTPAHLEVFHRQGILGGDKVPVLWGQQTEWLMDHADVGDVSNKRDWKHMEQIIGFNVTTSAAQVAKLPWAERHVMCNNEMMSECRSKAYRGTCWIDRPDITPATKQKSAPGGRASWHPGDRVHAWQGRMIAFGILRALDAALDQWMKAPQYQLSPDAWHVADYYRGIKEKVQSLEGECQKEESFSSTFCSTPVKARSEFTPRYNPAATSIRTLIKDGVHIPKSHANQYDPLDVYNPNLDVPAGVFDILPVLESGTDFLPNLARLRLYQPEPEPSLASSTPLVQSDMKPGQGWALSSRAAADNCDGTYDSFCGRGKEEDCLLYGHNDYRGGLLADSYSGWMVLNLDKVESGLIVVKMEDWHPSGVNPRTKDWNCENNDCPSSNLRRNLKADPPAYCDDFLFEFAINGKVTAWNKDEFVARQTNPQRVVQLWTLLDDPSFGPHENVELALRFTGCQRIKTLSLTHLYWA